MPRSRRTAKEIRRNITPRRPVFSGRQLISGRGRQVSTRPSISPLIRSGRPRVVLPLSWPRRDLSWISRPRVIRRPGPIGSPRARERLVKDRPSAVYRFPPAVKPFFLPSSDPCAQRRAVRAMMFVNGVAGRRWGSGGGPKPPTKRVVNSEVSCRR